MSLYPFASTSATIHSGVPLTVTSFPYSEDFDNFGAAELQSVFNLPYDLGLERRTLPAVVVLALILGIGLEYVFTEVFVIDLP